MSTKLRALEKSITIVENIFCAIGMGMFMVLMLLGTSDVIGRYVFNRPIMGTLEISQVLMAGMVLLAWAHTQAMRGHVTVQLLIDQYPPRLRAIVNFATLFLSLMFFSLIVWQSAMIAMWHWEEHRAFQTIPIPTAPFEFLVSVGAFVLCLEFLIQMLHLISDMRKEH